MTLSGISYIRNGLTCSYPILEALIQVEPYVDEFIISDGGSTDGTWELLQRMAARWSKIRLVQREWQLGYGGAAFREATDHAFSHAQGDWVLYVQADEIWWSQSAAHVRDLVSQVPDGYDGFAVPVYDIGGNFQVVRSVYNMQRILRNRKGLFSIGDSLAFGGLREQWRDVLDTEMPRIINLGWAFPLGGFHKEVEAVKWHNEGRDTAESMLGRLGLASYSKETFPQCLKNHLNWKWRSMEEQGNNTRIDTERFALKTSPIQNLLPPILHDFIGSPEYFVRDSLFE